MEWFLVVFFLVKGSWIEADKLDKEGWSPSMQPSYSICIERINKGNKNFRHIAESRNTELDIKMECECRLNSENPDLINCKERNWFQKIYDKLFLIK